MNEPLIKYLLRNTIIPFIVVALFIAVLVYLSNSPLRKTRDCDTVYSSIPLKGGFAEVDFQ